MNGKPAKTPPLALLVAGLGSLGLAAYHAPQAMRDLPRVVADLMAFPFGQVFVNDARNILPVLIFLPLGIAFFWFYFRLRGAATPWDSPMVGVRFEIDRLDGQLVALLAQRQRQIEAAAEVKRRNKIAARVPERVNEVLARVNAQAKEKHLDPDLAHSLWTAIIEWSIAYEERLMNKSSARELDTQ